MKKILFVINTLGQAGAETALLELFKRLKKEDCDIFLYVLMGQGEMFEQLPDWIKVLNSRFSTLSVLTKEGRSRMAATVLAALKTQLYNGLPFFNDEKKAYPNR